LIFDSSLFEREATMPCPSYPGGSDRAFVQARAPEPARGRKVKIEFLLLAAALVFVAAQLIW
jgi:hypothetical protein